MKFWFCVLLFSFLFSFTSHAYEKEKLSAGDLERILLRSYDHKPAEVFPLTVTAAIFDDGFGDYLHLKHVLTLLNELGYHDVDVVVFYAEMHKEKIRQNPLPTQNFNLVKLISFEKEGSQYFFEDNNQFTNVKENGLDDYILNCPYLKKYLFKQNELLVVSTFFSKAFGKLKEQSGRHPILLREVTPLLTNGAFQDLFVIGWANNQGVYVDGELLKTKNKIESNPNEAFEQLPKNLLQLMCWEKNPLPDHFKDYLSSHTMHYSYMHQGAPFAAYFFIILKSLQDHTAVAHDFFVPDLSILLPVMQNEAFQNYFKIALNAKQIELISVNRSVITLDLNPSQTKKVRIIETGYLSDQAHFALRSLCSTSILEGCSGDNSSQEALQLGHLPFIEHTSSKDFRQPSGVVDTIHYQNSYSLFQAVSQLQPYPNELGQFLYLTHLLLRGVRLQNVETLNTRETRLLINQLGKKLNSKQLQKELRIFSNFVTKERSLKPLLRQILRRQYWLKQHPYSLPIFESILTSISFP